ncbi:hypothetical protein ABMA67_02530 [Halobacteriovorax sp. RZ-3]|uniref:hypothetical protein n=1 Tax=Halobacteriovorax sp. RZ-3 TaxID=3157720 RepID=UPI00371BDC8B
MPAVNEYLYLKTPVFNDIIQLKHYILSFAIVFLIYLAIRNRSILKFIDGTEATHKFLQTKVGIDSRNSIMVFLKSGKILIGPLIDADLHKNIDDDSITIKPLISATREASSGKLKITSLNINIEFSEDSLVIMTPVHKEITNNIPINSIDYLSVFNLKAFASYVANGDIEWIETDTSIKQYLAMLSQIS